MTVFSFKRLFSSLLISCCVWVFVDFAPIQAASPWNSPIPIPNSAQAGSDIFTSYNNSLGLSIATWLDLSNSHPIFATYNGKNWSLPTAIPSSVAASFFRVFSSYNSASGDTLVTWVDAGVLPIFAIYNGSWIAPANIPLAGQVLSDVFSSYNAALNAFIVTWQDMSSMLPFFTAYNGSSWTMPAAIPGSMPIFTDIVSSYNPALGVTIATWVDSLGDPFFSIYNGTSWTLPIAIPGSIPTNSDLVFSSYNSALNATLVTWPDLASTGLPFFALYNGTSWSTPTSIPGSRATAMGVNVYSSYNDALGASVVTWTDISNVPYFSIYNGTNWSTPQAISTVSATADNNIFSSYNNVAATTLATWIPMGMQFPIFTTYIVSPSNFSGMQKVNDFALVSERFNALSWEISLSGGIAGYYLYRNGVLIATLGPVVYSYEDHNRMKDQADTYTLIAFTNEGAISSSVTVRVGG